MSFQSRGKTRKLTGLGAETGVGGGVALGAGHKTSPW
jgi:hypothetical protein